MAFPGPGLGPELFSALSARFSEKSGEYGGHVLLPAAGTANLCSLKIRDLHDKAENLFTGKTPELISGHMRPPVTRRE